MNNINHTLYIHLCKLSAKQFKVFYGIFVHCWAHNKSFLSMQNFFNLWCELNYLCHELDESFPDWYDDHNEIKSFCQQNPFYFIDILPLELIAKLFAEYCDERLQILENLVQILYKQGSWAAHQYVIEEFKLGHTADEMAADLEEHIRNSSSL